MLSKCPILLSNCFICRSNFYQMRPFIVILCLLSMISCAERAQDQSDPLVEKAMEIHEKVITIDTHNDIDVRNFTDTVNYTQRLDTQVNLPKMQEGGLDVSWLIVYTAQDSLNKSGYEKARENAIAKFDAIHRLCEEIAPDQINLALTSEDVRRIHASGKKVAMIGVENAYPLGEDLSDLEEYHRRGARYMSLAHNGHSQFCDSHTGEADSTWLYNGLSELGKKAVKQMNKLGIMIDLSHLSKESTDQILRTSKAPVMASHSSARKLCDHSRNLDDESLMLLKENGGVVQTVALGTYIDQSKSEARENYMTKVYHAVADSLGVSWYSWDDFADLPEEEQDSFLLNYPRVVALSNERVADLKDAPPAVNVSDFVNHIDYMVELIGIDHVGISSDFDGGGGIEGWSDASETPNVTIELVKRGYTEEEIAKLWGGNLLRVLDEVQQYAATPGS